MGSKRDHTVLDSASDENTPIDHSSKRRRENAPAKPKPAEARVDATYGQRAAFPGLDGPIGLSDDDLEYEDAGDALAYLKSVRRQADTIPNVLVAPKVGPQLPSDYYGADSGDGDFDRSIYESGVGDYRGYYEDGAYVAAPDTESSADSEIYGNGDVGSNLSPVIVNKRLREAFYASLASKFTALRELLHRQPPQQLIDALPEDHETKVGRFGARSKVLKVWTRRILNTDPLPVQIAAMNSESVFKLLRVILKGNFISHGYELRERTSRWIWALLARLPDKGELDHNDISWIRELGKRAVLMMVSASQMEALREQVEDGLERSDVEVGDQDEVAAEEEVDMDQDYGEISEKLSDHPENDNQPGSEPQESTAAEASDDGEMDMDIDDGEVSDDPDAPKDTAADIEAAKARLLARLEASSVPAGDDLQSGSRSPNPHRANNGDAQDGKQGVCDETNPRLNTIATLNMILTVVGEFYGQRDLLDFRDPFPSQ